MKKSLFLSYNYKGKIQISLEPLQKIILTFVFKPTYLPIGD